MAKKDFFAEDDQQPDDQGTAGDKLKLGEEEFTEEELKEAVGAWKLKKDVEEKFNTSLDKVYPEFTKKSQELKELREAEEARAKEAEEAKAKAEADELAKKQAEGEQLSPEEIRKLAIKQGFITKDNLIPEVLNVLEGRRTLNRAKKLETKGNPYDAEDLPKFESQDMFNWMSTTPGMGNVDPEVAYKIRFEKEIDAWKAKTLSQGKRKGLTTATGSKPGGKQPEPVKVTDENLNDQIRAAVRGEI